VSPRIAPAAGSAHGRDAAIPNTEGPMDGIAAGAAWSRADLAAMDRVLELARRAYGQTSPNPHVGAVVTRGGEVLGTGFHARAGLAHAEPQALEEARRNSRSTTGPDRDWTLYVNLEPCVHHGRTPPCVDAILAAPVGRVVVGHVDPDPRVAGGGIARLRAAGIRVDVGCRAAAALDLNRVFDLRAQRGRPAILLKVALAADGSVAAADRSPVAITGHAARVHAHALRAGVDAILVGVETLRLDRPRLDRRLHPGPGSTPRRAIVDPRLRSEPAWLWPGEPRPVLFCSRAALAARGPGLEPHVDLVPLPEAGDGLDLRALPDALAGLGLWSLLVEGGGRTHLRFLQADLWDQFYLYRNPRLRLDGLAWAPRAAWEEKLRHAVRLESSRLGRDTLEVYLHPSLRRREPAQRG
jgi:diaminohydroxyphosphoribosylaminopyrimidine deaminase/5-amino-6-(5-phosphoribosylamino)uracil reductase